MERPRETVTVRAGIGQWHRQGAHRQFQHPQAGFPHVETPNPASRIAV